MASARVQRPRVQNRFRGRSGCLPMALMGAASIGLGANYFNWSSSPAAMLSFPGQAEAEPESVTRAKVALQNADAVCFDVDSTVVKSEGIDVLASCFGVYDQVANLTKTAMEGGMKFQDAMAMRLQIMQPTVEGVEKCLKSEKQHLTWGMRAVMKRLKERGADIYLVSGGFTLMINPIANLLGIPQERVFANTILFDEAGNYADFDRNAPTSKSGGKPAVVALLKEAHGYNTMVMIGDGATDMDARPPADAFIGYGGVQVRPAVKEGADWFITSWREVLRVL